MIWCYEFRDAIKNLIKYAAFVPSFKFNFLYLVRNPTAWDAISNGVYL